MKTLDIYIVGLGGMGVLTIGELISQAAMTKGLAVNFYPTKGMSQRGGFVQAQLRVGQADAGPSLPARGADLIIAMERSEALKAVRYCQAGTDFLLFDDVVAPTAVVLGKATYPELTTVWQQGQQAGARMLYLAADLPTFQNAKVRANLYIVGAALANTALGELFSAEELSKACDVLWSKGGESNLFAMQAGINAKCLSVLA